MLQQGRILNPTLPHFVPCFAPHLAVTSCGDTKVLNRTTPSLRSVDCMESRLRDMRCSTRSEKGGRCDS